MWEYPEYISVEKRKKNAAKRLEKLKKKNPNIQPVIITGKKLVTTWWGMAWNKNLESYADYDNRIGRGRSYLRHGSVLDLKIDKGIVTSLINGSGSKPYKIKIIIEPLTQKKWDEILQKCAKSISGLEELVTGKFPKELEETFMKQQSGLFPSPKEIKFDCNCPDYAHMCKHIAATLYAIGTRLDDDPILFFKLRDIDFESLLKKSIEEKMQNMLKNANKKSTRIINDADIGSLFEF